MEANTYKHLFQLGKIGNLELKNRIIMPGMGTTLASVWGEVTEDLIEWYAARARGGVAMVIIQPAITASAVDRLRVSPKQLRIDDDCYCQGLGELVDVIHEAGAKASIQLNPGGGAQAGQGPWLPGLRYVEDIPPVAPSNVPSPRYQRKPRELTVSEIAKIVELCGRAAGRAKQVGLDSVEIQAHGGYLIGEFISPFFNKRTDQYGGPLENRMRFLLEIIDSTRKFVGFQFPITVRYSVDEFYPGGVELKEGQEIARRLEQAGVDAINISCGMYGARQPATAPVYFPEGYLLPLARAVKKAVKIPVIVAGRLGNPATAERVLREGDADFIGMGRPLIADPELTNKAAAGNAAEIRRCVVCNTCLKMVNSDAKGIRCALNAAAGRERRYGALKPTAVKKNLVVIGAGPAGMEAARIAALRNHKVTLFEKDIELGGGQLRLASVPPHKEVFRSIAAYYSAVFSKLNNLEVRAGKEASATEIIRLKPDAVIVATGGLPVIPAIPGIDSSNVVTAFDVLAGKADTGKEVIVAGGGAVGCETANFLSRQGREVTVIEMLDAVATDMEWRTWLALKEELAQGGVQVLTGARIDEITRGGIRATIKDEQVFFKADTVVLALGVQPNNKLVSELEGKVPELHVIGDAHSPGKIRDAVSAGFILGNSL